MSSKDQYSTGVGENKLNVNEVEVVDMSDVFDDQERKSKLGTREIPEGGDFTLRDHGQVAVTSNGKWLTHDGATVTQTLEQADRHSSP